MRNTRKIYSVVKDAESPKCEKYIFKYCVSKGADQNIRVYEIEIDTAEVTTREWNQAHGEGSTDTEENVARLVQSLDFWKGYRTDTNLSTDQHQVPVGESLENSGDLSDSESRPAGRLEEPQSPEDHQENSCNALSRTDRHAGQGDQSKDTSGQAENQGNGEYGVHLSLGSFFHGLDPAKHFCGKWRAAFIGETVLALGEGI
ncbi:hypothetical protein RRG08_048922 [Elysia crispata]|uniref:Uncharacterized protein n=1 Tax=Elysia crispata TaxID=231223 RepID=A0AAE1A599_9GAST|nr:hypothetical protein RRG08_048922 [Elysia crispata]